MLVLLRKAWYDMPIRRCAMKDMPVFTTENGAASLILREIPYQQTAYVVLRDTLDPLALAGECADFCRVCGA